MSAPSPVADLSARLEASLIRSTCEEWSQPGAGNLHTDHRTVAEWARRVGGAWRAIEGRGAAFADAVQLALGDLGFTRKTGPELLTIIERQQALTRARRANGGL